MRRALGTGRHCVLASAALFLFGAGVPAADLTLEPQFSSDQDLLLVVPSDNGGIGILRQGSIDLLDPGEENPAIVRAAGPEVLYLGDGGNRIGVATHRHGAADFAPTTSFELRDRSGTVLWRIGATEDVTYKISRTGAVVGMSLNINVPERNALHFYGEEGLLEAEVSVPHLLTGRFDPDGDLFFALSAREGLIAFDPKGAELWRGGEARMFAVTPGGRLAAVLGSEDLRIIRAGETVAATSIGDLLVRRIAIAPDGSRVAVAGKREIRVYDGSDLRALWDVPLETENLSWTSVDVGADGGWLVAGIARDLGPGVPAQIRHPDGEVRAYDGSGGLMHRSRLEFSIWNIWTPTAVLDRSGSGATITTRRAVYRTVLP